MERFSLGAFGPPRDCWSPSKPTRCFGSVSAIRVYPLRNFVNLVVADSLAPPLDLNDGGGGVLHCVLLVPIHSGVEARNCRNLPEMLVTMRVKVLKVDTWFSTVSCSPFQPAMARLCPPSVSLHRQKRFFPQSRLRGSTTCKRPPASPPPPSSSWSWV